MRYELTPNLLTGHIMIDAQHKELFKAINNLMDACATGHGRDNIKTTFNFLQNYTIKHFSDEERLQQSVNYPDYDRHIVLHEQYKKLSAEVGDYLIKEGATIKTLADLNRAVSVLINHVKIEDKKIAEFIAKSKA